MFKKKYKSRLVVTQKPDGKCLFEIDGIANNVLGMLIYATAATINEMWVGNISDDSLAEIVKDGVLKHLKSYRGET